MISGVRFWKVLRVAPNAFAAPAAVWTFTNTGFPGGLRVPVGGSDDRTP